MFRIRRPSPKAISSVLARLEDAPFSYKEVGVTRSGWRALPPSLRKTYAIDRHEVRLGEGRDLFELARKALFAWAPFDFDWVELHGAEAPVEFGKVVATLTRAMGVWTLNPCSVVYVADGEPGRAAFAYGTLRGHVEAGEERFQVMLDPQTDAVSYGILSVSRPKQLLAQLAYPYARRFQRRFREASAQAMLRAVGVDS